MLQKINDLSKSSRLYFVILFLLMSFSIMRLAFIHSDAPQDLTVSASIYTDEGFKTYASRNKVLFSNWKWSKIDGYSNWSNKSPLSTWTYYLSFKLFGTGTFAIRIVSIFYSILTILVLFIFLLRRFNMQTALLGIILFGSNFFLIMFNRLGDYESHLNFYIMLSLFLISEGIYVKSIPLKVLLFISGCAALAPTFFIKSSIILVIISIFPVLVLLITQNVIKSARLTRRTFFGIIAFIFISYVILAHLQSFQNIFKTTLNQKLFHQSIIKSFSPLHETIGKSLYLEFIFLQPLSFCIGMFYAIFTFYNFIQKKIVNIIDLVLSSWLLFGFYMLTIMSYHPARYYVLLSIPLMVLCARALVKAKDFDYRAFIYETKPFTFRFLLIVLSIGLILHSGNSIMMQIFPFSFRKYLYQLTYPSLLKGDIVTILPILAAVACYYATIIFVLFILRKKIMRTLLRHNFPSILLSLILFLQLFQYGKWTLFHENKLTHLSMKLGHLLPHNAIIAGSWSAGLVNDNKLRALVMQSKSPYNRDVMKKLIANEEIPIYRYKNNQPDETWEKNQPLYLAVCPGVIFEQHIVKQFKKYIIPANLYLKEDLGYFRVEIYKIKD